MAKQVNERDRLGARITLRLNEKTARALRKLVGGKRGMSRFVRDLILGAARGVA